MTSEVQPRQSFRKTHFVAMEPQSISNSRLLQHNSNSNSNSDSSQTGQQNNNLIYSSSSNQLTSSSNNDENKRNAIVKQYDRDSKHHQTPSDHHSSFEPEIHHHSNQVEGCNSSSSGGRCDRDESDMSKNHVGPVMGIFFKVWSLVKVTKVRHQNKMRRQNSEDANQFQYVSGDQLAGGHHRPALLQDRHFRRAGSQPAPSTSGLHCNHQPPLEANQQNQQHQQHHQPMAWLQVANSPGAMAGSSGAGHHGFALAHPLAAHATTTTTTGTSSTSSGVSSTSSCIGGQTMATSSSNNQTPSPPASGSARSRRHLSAYSLRRSTADVLVPATSNNNIKANKASKSGGSAGAGDSWASKIKRSATTVNQADFSSYVSRYRFRRDQPTTTTTATNGHGRHSKEAGPIGQFFSSSSRDTTPVHEGQPRLCNSAYSDNNQNFNTNIDNFNLELISANVGGGGSGDDDNDDEATSNDIYSTPNDSIQSVPSTEPVISNDKLSYGVPLVSRQPASSQASLPPAPPLHPITKSFSTSSFNQLIKQHQQQTQQQQRFTPIHESCNKTLDEGARHPCQAAAAAQDDNRRPNSSRFFLSSSSSEDSNNQSSGNTNATNTGASNSVRNNQTCLLQLDQAMRDTPLEQHQQQVAVQKGVHCHAFQVAQRPDTLFVHTQPGPYAMPVSLLTPAARCGLALPLGGLSSPLNCLPVGTPPLPAATTSVNRQPHQLPPAATSYLRSGYRKSPSLFEISSSSSASNVGQGPLPARANVSSRFSSKYPIQSSRLQMGNFVANGNGGRLNVAASRVAPPLEPERSHELLGASEQMAPNSSLQQQQQPTAATSTTRPSSMTQMPNSISLHDCKLSSQNQRQSLSYLASQLEAPQPSALWPDVAPVGTGAAPPSELDSGTVAGSSSEYRLAQMLLECGSNPSAKDANGYSVLMHAILSDNLPAVKCLVEHGADLNDTNNQDQTALDLLCSRAPTRGRLELLKLLIDHRADLDRTRTSDGTRLLDRLIDEHHHCADKLPFIDCLLQNGAKLGSSTWLAASEKYEIQLRLLQKLCQDGYFLYKKSSIEAAVYRFEYALRRLAELEQQLASNHFHHPSIHMVSQSFIPMAARQLKYQTYLGLSRCERKRKFYKRALEFAHLAILVDSTSYEGYYSKAHILKDLGEIDDALLAIEQTQRLVAKSIESMKLGLNELQQQQEEASMFDGRFSRLDQRQFRWIEASRLELGENLDYMQEAKRFVSKLKAEIMDDKLNYIGGSAAQTDETPLPTSQQQLSFSIATKPIAI